MQLIAETTLSVNLGGDKLAVARLKTYRSLALSLVVSIPDSAHLDMAGEPISLLRLQFDLQRGW